MKPACLLVVPFLFVTFGALQKADFKLEVGAQLPAKYVPANNRKLYMTHSAQFRPYIEREVEGVSYIIAYDDTTRVIKYISTNDKRFKPTNGLEVSGYVEVNDEQVEVYPGWEIRGPKDKDGWQPLIGFDNELTVLDGDKDTKIVLKEYRLGSRGPVKAKIIAFVKGAN